MARQPDEVSARKERVRQCAVTRVRRPLCDLVRFCVDPDGRVVPDLKGRLPGRGVWVTASLETVAEAVRKAAFPRGFARSVSVDDTLPGQLDGLVEKAALDRLSLANKAGLVVAGFTKVAERTRNGKTAALVHAQDAAPGGREKLDRLAGPACRIIDCFTSSQLSLALGRSNVVHAALSKGGACENFLTAVDRLERYRSSEAVFSAA